MPKPKVKTAAEETAPRRRPKQLKFAGVTPAVHEDVESAAEDYVNARDRRMSATEKEVETQTVLLSTMKKHGLTSYRYDEKVVVVTAAEKVKVKSVEDNGEADE